MALSLQALPLELVYRVFDFLTDRQLLLSVSNVCQRLNANAILNAYERYTVDQVKHTNDLLIALVTKPTHTIILVFASLKFYSICRHSHN